MSNRESFFVSRKEQLEKPIEIYSVGYGSASACGRVQALCTRIAIELSNSHIKFYMCGIDKLGMKIYIPGAEENKARETAVTAKIPKWSKWLAKNPKD
jgi:hypothetical protein